jgi:hypothetical protein
MIPSVRITAATTMTLAAAGLLAPGCGGGHSSNVTRAQAVAFARSVNLRARDVPEMHAFFGREDNGELVRFELIPQHGCGAIDRGERIDVNSPIFSLGHGYPTPLPAEGLHSRIQVMRSSGEQERDFAARACDVRRSESKRGAAREIDLPSPLPGIRVHAVRTWQVAPRYMFARANITRYSDRFTFSVGPAEVILSVAGAPHPPRAELERRLLSLLYRRAAAHKL